MNIGWLLISHVKYSNQVMARSDLQRRMVRDTIDFELVPHTLSHITSKGTEIAIKLLKVRADYDSRQVIFMSLLECLKKGSDNTSLTEMSNTAEWKLIPFAQNTLSRDQATELIKKQNWYLHQAHAILFINIGSLDGSFQSGKRTEGGSKRNMNEEGGG